MFGGLIAKLEHQNLKKLYFYLFKHFIRFRVKILNF